MPDQRYLRHEQIEGFSQQCITGLNVLVVGAGAIGNEVVKNLTLLGVGKLSLYDLDRVEIHNLTRSVLLRESDIGQNKAASVAARANELDPAVEIAAIAGDIHDTLDLASVRAADIVIGCTDNFEARIRINQLCLLAGTPWINTAIDARFASIELYPFDLPQAMACYECTLPQSVYQKISERQSCGGLHRAAIAQQVMPTTTIGASIAAALACNEALKHCQCDRRMSTEANTGVAVRLFADTLRGTSDRTLLSQAQLCPCCGLLPRNASVMARVDTGTDLHKFAQAESDTPVLLSDKIIWHCVCEQCGDTQAADAFGGHRAGSLTDAITVCARCRQPGVKVEIREQFTIDELIERFGTSPVPACWGLIGNSIIEFKRPAPSP